MNQQVTQIQNVYQGSDLRMFVQFSDGRVPAFKFTYYTDPYKPYEVSYDGVTTSNCELGVNPGEIIIRRDAPHFTPGVLYAKRDYPNADPKFKDGTYNYSKTAATSITIVKEMTQDDGPNPQERIIKEQTTPPTLDYTSTAEQAVEGEFWFSPDGITKKKVYLRTFTGISPLVGEDLVIASGIQGYSVIAGGINFSGGYVPPFTFDNINWTLYINSVNELQLTVTTTTIANMYYMIVLKYIRK